MPAYTQQDVDLLRTQVAGLNTAIADGVRQVTIGGQTVTYNTSQSLIMARDDAARRLAAAEAEVAGRRRSKITYLQYGGRGY